MKTLIRSLLCAALPVAACNAQAPTFHEPFRPAVHFSPAQHWINDPNGLVYFEGEYHLFFQYNPTASVPGHIGWGHAVSRDLLHWEELPEALPERDGEMVFTGSVVVDEKNSSGLCEGGKPCLIAVYTGHRGEGADRLEAQNIAASQDRGRTWTRFSGNPVLNLHLPEFRDPGVSWNDLTKSWLMAVAMPNDHKVSLYTSKDLKQWAHLSDFGPAGTTAGQWECPNLLKVPSASGQGADLWAMKVGINPGGLQGGSGEQYFLGSFDGQRFTQSTAAGSHGWTDYGKDSYCAISFNHLPAGSRPTLIGWMNNWQYAAKVPTSPWRGQMTLPRTAHYLRDADGFALVEEPLVKPLRDGSAKPFSAKLSAGRGEGPALQGQSPMELSAVFSAAMGKDVGLRLYSDETHWTEIGFSSERKLYVDRRRSGQEVAPDFPVRTEVALAPRRALDLHIVVDSNSVEVFAQGGTLAMTNLVFPPAQTLRIVPFRSGGGGSGPVGVKGEMWRLRSIHP